MSGIPARKTEYKGYLFRSSLEARWAAFFDQLGVEWRYEALDLNGYIPDFILPNTNLLIEVKPLLKVEDAVQHIEKVSRAWDGDFIIVGAHWHLGSSPNIERWLEFPYAGGEPSREARAIGFKGIYIEDWEEINARIKTPGESLSKHMTWPVYWVPRDGGAVWDHRTVVEMEFLEEGASERCAELYARLDQAWAAAHRLTQWRPRKTP